MRERCSALDVGGGRWGQRNEGHHRCVFSLSRFPPRQVWILFADLSGENCFINLELGARGPLQPSELWLYLRVQGRLP